jgi:hypothetical protein
MKTSRLSQNLVFFLPILCVVASAGIVVQQSSRHDRLEREVAAMNAEQERLEKRLKELKNPAGASAPEEESHTHAHHDGHGD